MSKKVNQIVLNFILTNILTYFVIGLVCYLEFKDDNLHFYIFDVGQGDSIMIKTPSREYILIDGGPDNSVVYKLGKFLPFYKRQIDFVILTHADKDHIAGLVEVLRRYNVQYVITTNFIHTSSYFRQWQQELSDTTVLIVDEPKQMSLGGVKFYFIHPLNNDPDSSVNNGSVVFKLEYKNLSALFTGDFENEESFLDSSSFDLKSDFLKVGHHGAKNANNYEFLAAVNPKVVAISSGRNNKFGHPHPETISGLEMLYAEVFRTDLLGDLHFVASETSFKYQP